MSDDQAPVEVYSARDTPEAYLVRGLLREAGIEAIVVGEGLGGITGELPPLQATPRIWVRPVDAGRARQLVEQYDRETAKRASASSSPERAGSTPTPAEPFCYHCGQSISYGQSPCPACGNPLEWDPDDSSVRFSRVDSPTVPGSQWIVFEPVDGVGVLTLNNPGKRNALSSAALTELYEQLQGIASDKSIRAVIIRAVGSTFSAGHDLRELVNATEHEHRALFKLCSEVMELIRNLPQPVIAEVQGVATAAGCQLAATCDLVVASDTATFATPGVKIGLFCSTPAVALSRVVPLKRAMEMLLTGEPISAREAERIGLVNRVVPAAQLQDEAMKLARQVITSSSDTLGLGKRTFYQQLPLNPSAAYELTSRVMTENAQLPDAQEGMRAFLEKRLPTWRRSAIGSSLGVAGAEALRSPGRGIADSATATPEWSPQCSNERFLIPAPCKTTLAIMSAVPKAQLVSVDEYLAGELVSPVKHEYLGGVVYAMAGARNAHNLIASNTLVSLGSRLRGSQCRPYNSDTKIRIRLPSHVRFYYPDVSVICRPNPQTDSFQDEPAVIVEVVSRSSRRIDEGEKKEAYTAVPSLGIYLIVEQETATVVAFRRTEQGFVREVYCDLKASIPLAEIGTELPLREVYDGVEFSPEPDATAD